MNCVLMIHHPLPLLVTTHSPPTVSASFMSSNPFATLDLWWARRTDNGTRQWPARPRDLELCKAGESGNFDLLHHILMSGWCISARYPIGHFGGRWVGGVNGTSEPQLIPEEETYQYKVEGKKLTPEQKRCTGEWMPTLGW